MSKNLQPVTLTDRSSPAKSVVYTPRQIVDGVGILINPGPEGALVGQSQLSVVSRRKNGGSKRVEAVLKLTLPKTVVETVNGVAVPKVIGTSYATVTVDLDPQFTDADAANMAGQLESAFHADQEFLQAVMFERFNVFS